MSRSEKGVWPSLSVEAPHASVPLVSIPFSDVQRIQPQGIYEEALHAFPVDRLDKVKQLSFAVFEGKATGTVYRFEMPFYTRFHHSFGVATLMDRVLEQNGFSQKERDIGIVAALTHDLATPALGDATKKVAPERLDEEEYWGEVISAKGEMFLRKHAIPKDLVAATIKNEGVLGKVLDIVDRVTYGMDDMQVSPRQLDENHRSNRGIDQDLRGFTDILIEDPLVGNIYHDIVVDQEEDEVYFTNPKRLHAFLKLRALNHQQFYMNPYTIGRDVLLGNLIQPVLESDPTASPQHMRQMWDVELLAKLHPQFVPGHPDRDEVYYQLVQWVPNVKRYDTEEALQEGLKSISN